MIRALSFLVLKSNDGSTRPRTNEAVAKGGGSIVTEISS